MKSKLIQLTATVALMFACSSAVFSLTQIDRPFSQLVDLAEIILVGTVNDAYSEWGEGKLAGTIFTVLTFDDLDVIKGDVPGTTYEFRHVGGRIGDLIHSYEGLPRLSVGARYVLFISGDTNTLFPLVGIGQGAFIVTRDDGASTEKVQTINGLDVLGIADDRIVTSGSDEPVTLEQFLTHIENEMKGVPP
jgi:hypothetical protein